MEGGVPENGKVHLKVAVNDTATGLCGIAQPKIIMVTAHAFEE